MNERTIVVYFDTEEGAKEFASSSPLYISIGQHHNWRFNELWAVMILNNVDPNPKT